MFSPREKKRAVRNALKKSKSRGTGRLDPTQTVTMRRVFCQHLRKQWALLKGRIIKLVVDEDCFGLKKAKPLTNIQAVTKYIPFVCNKAVGWFPVHNCDPFLDWVEDVRQRDHFSCGAACAMSVGHPLGVGPDTLEGWKHLLGTDVEESTHPDAIFHAFLGMGCPVVDKEGMTLDDLSQFLSKGWPVIVCVQDYGPAVPERARFDYGHYLVVISRSMGYVFCQDPSEDNVVAGGDSTPLSKTGSVQKPGRIMIDEETFMSIWHDVTSTGERKIRYGIAVGPPVSSSQESGREPVVNAGQFAFMSKPDQVKAFQVWLQQQFGQLLTGADERKLWDAYIQAGFKKGAGRSFDDFMRSKLAGKIAMAPDAATQQGAMDFYQGTKEEFLRSSFAQPVAIDKVQLLAGRSFDDLENVTDDMSTKMTRELMDGLVQGDSPLEVAKALNEQCDLGEARSETVARTELVRAHAEGQLTALEGLGVEELGVAVEWSTSGLNEVDKKGRPVSPCERCIPMAGVVLKMDEARGMIPFHPNCRCAWLPANVGEDEEDRKVQKDTKGKIEDALDEAGVDDKEVSKNRPESIFNIYGQQWQESRGLEYDQEMRELEQEGLNDLIKFSRFLNGQEE